MTPHLVEVKAMTHPGVNYGAVGVRVRLGRILRDGKAVIFAFDHGFEHGPKDFPEDRVAARNIIQQVVDAGVDAIMLLPGMARLTHDIWAGRTALIVKLTSKTELRPESSIYLQTRLATVEDAVALGADAVAATVYWGSEHESEMMENWMIIKEEAEAYGMPALQLAYPRGSHFKNWYDPEVVMYGVRAAIEVGADLIKTYYTGSRETFAKVVEMAQGIPVVMSGGAVRDRPVDFLTDLSNVIAAGGSGVAVGRNVFRAKDIKSMARAVMAVVHEGLSPEEAAKRFNLE
ncbi:Fructose-1,6-bisphosphate aldolase [Acidilobus saccharovorans 345-15]|uniref:fructose-bisphosphate aldolase n=2 Tax=Acidilobus TaxID=105850 RepID=D9PZE9_ACIS3|nr:Fructose-1,6-bisphosphate aldolase [Acidilobus saccharovorans 345-15]